MPKENKNIQPSPSQEKLPFWKALLVKALRKTTDILETTAVKLETEPLVSSEEKSGFLQKIQQFWISILSKIRLIVPAKLSAKFSDTALTGIIGGFAVMVFLITSNVFDSKVSPVEVITTEKEIPAVVSTPIADKEEDISKSTQQEEISSVIKEENPSNQQQEIIPPKEEVTPLTSKSESLSNKEQEIPLPSKSEIVSNQEPENPSLEKEKTPVPSKPEVLPNQEQQNPSLEEKIVVQEKLETTNEFLTPEETLIAAIQNQVNEISNQTFSGIIESIQANFLDSNLTIKISNNWYELEKKQQDKLAAEILQRSQELDFTHLEMLDLQGKLIARNPVVGTEMIIFQRK